MYKKTWVCQKIRKPGPKYELTKYTKVPCPKWETKDLYPKLTSPNIADNRKTKIHLSEKTCPARKINYPIDTLVST
jgi:hypothetical protein